MADTRDISQQYAQGAIRTAVLLNSGAIIAALSQLGELSRISDDPFMARPFSFWILGALLGACCWWPAFLSARALEHARRRSIPAAERRASLDWSRTLQSLGILAFLASLACFGGGAFSVVTALR